MPALLCHSTILFKVSTGEGVYLGDSPLSEVSFAVSDLGRLVFNCGNECYCAVWYLCCCRKGDYGHTIIDPQSLLAGIPTTVL